MIKLSLTTEEDTWTVEIPEPTTERPVTYWCTQVGNVTDKFLDKILADRLLK